LGDNPLQSYRFVCIGQTVQQGFDRVFEHLNLRIWNANNGMKCVPGKTKKLCCWSILKFYRKILRTRRKTNSALRSTWALTTDYGLDQGSLWKSVTPYVKHD
jgi:hypothetical protein